MCRYICTHTHTHIYVCVLTRCPIAPPGGLATVSSTKPLARSLRYVYIYVYIYIYIYE